MNLWPSLLLILIQIIKCPLVEINSSSFDVSKSVFLNLKSSNQNKQSAMTDPVLKGMESIKPFCFVCDKEFDQQTDLEVHFQTNHARSIKEEDVKINISKSDPLKIEPLDFEQNCSFNNTNPINKIKTEVKVLQNGLNNSSEKIDVTILPNVSKKYLIEFKDQVKAQGNAKQKVIAYKCNICDKTFTSEKTLSWHKSKVHGVANNDKYPCNKCEKIFNTYVGRKFHVASFHEGERVRCNQCNKCFTRVQLLNNHLFYEHKIYNHKCDSCDKAFISNHALDKHRLSSHGIKIECENCGKKFNLQKWLYEHISRSCVASKKSTSDITKHNHECDQCGSSFASKNSFKNHKIKVHGEKSKCAICQKSIERGFMKRHIFQAHGGSEKHKCDLCEATFEKLFDVAQHNKTVHKKDFKYQCDQCNKSFHTYYGKKFHVKSVHEGQRFKCDICGHMYTMMSSLNSHKRKVHKN